jgi:hypothetical protein
MTLADIDCNCNDCKFMVRDFDKHNESQRLHYHWQLDYFNTVKNNLIKRAKWHKDVKNDLVIWDMLMTEAEEMVFLPNKKEASISYGNCQKFNKQVSFIPNICQLETQQCFENRRNVQV